MKPSPSPRRILTTIGCLGAFALGLFGSGAIVETKLPFPPVGGVQEKIEWLREHGEEYDTLFVGTSRTYGGLQPALFDQAMAQAGMPTHSFNLGINGMRPPEDTYVLEHALAHRRKPLKLVILECNPVHVMTDFNAKTRRLPYWHDVKRSTSILRATFAPPDDGRQHWFRAWKTYTQQWQSLYIDAVLFGAHGVNIGRGREELDVYFGAQPFIPLGKNGDREDGWDESDSVQNITDDEWKDFEKDIANYPKHPATPSYANRETQRQIQEKVRMIRSLGGEVIGFIPAFLGNTELKIDPKVGPVFPVFNFGDPAAYPELFRRESRLDKGHLNAAGSKLLTKLLAEKVIAIRASKETPTASAGRK